MRRTWMAVLVLAAGCDGIDLHELVRQHAARTRVAVEPRGEHCEHGGQAVQTGVDLDDDGELDDGEVTSTEYVCAQALARQRQEPAGANCEHGGQAVQTGVDLDSSGALDDAEVTATEYVCATAVPEVLVRTRPVPPGAHCPMGGQVAHAGRDTNGNGLLEDGEITREAHGCTEKDPVLVRLSVRPPEPFSASCRIEGTLVEAGSDVNRNGVLEDGELRASAPLCLSFNQAVYRLRPEPAGAACATGGTAVDAGADSDGNGTLGDHEVLVSAYVCQPTLTFDGDYVVDDAADLEALKNLSRIRGRLTLLGDELTEVLLPNLVAVDGALRITSTSVMTRLELPGLRYVGGELYLGYNSSLETLVVGSGLEQAVWVGTDLLLIENPKLTTLTGLGPVSPRHDVVLELLPGLQSPGVLTQVQHLTGSVHISGNSLLQELPLANLRQVDGAFRLDDNDALSAVNGVTSLTSIGGSLFITNNDALVSLAGLPVEKVGGTLHIQGNDSLQAAGELSRLLRVGAISVTGNAALETVSNMPALELVEGDVSIGANPKLRAVEDLRALGYVGGNLFIGGSPLLSSLTGFGRLPRLKQLEVRNSDALTSLSDLAALRELGELVVQQNPNLTLLGLSGLTRVSTAFTVTDNPKLPGCLATSLADAVYTDPAGQRDIARNDEVTPCGP